MNKITGWLLCRVCGRTLTDEDGHGIGPGRVEYARDRAARAAEALQLARREYDGEEWPASLTAYCLDCAPSWPTGVR